MKKIIAICSALLFAFTIFQAKQVNAQDYLITFAGTGAATTVSTVEVENLPSGATTTLNGGDILHLTSNVGISQPEKINSSGMRIYPNPLIDNSIIALSPPEAGDAVITVYEMTGKTVAKIHTSLENGSQEFRLSGLKNGMYLINVIGNSYQYIAKILASGQAGGNPGIEKVSSTAESQGEKISKKEFSVTQGTVDMYYTAGDRLKFKAISGIYSTVKTDIPTEDKTLSFNFVPCTDGDNNNYPVVEIESQIWMAENLKTTKFNDNSDIPLVEQATTWGALSTPGYCWYNNDESANKATYGALYNRYTVNNGKLCPAGWHVPTDAEWETLEMNLGMTQGDADAKGWRGTDQSTKLKNTNGWNSGGNGSNTSGYSALPGGYRSYSGSFRAIGNFGSWWSSSEYDTRSAWLRELDYNYGSVYRGYYDESGGFSVRCLRDLPTLTTINVSEISTNSAISGGEIPSDWGKPVTARGVCWSSMHTPTLEDTLTSDGNGIGAFTSSLSGLQPNLTYFIRAYATNSQGTDYGNMITFKTFPLWPTLSTTAITKITETEAISGGSIINIGSSTINARGVCWSTNEDPTIADGLVLDSSELDSFTCLITGLTVYTKYYVRAFATNSLGTGYGNEIMFVTKGETGSVTDIDGNTYSTIKIGTQIWMAENLKTTQYNDGAPIPLVTDANAWYNLSTPGYCWYNNEASHKATYGALYNWFAVNTGKLCPTGWHVPADAEWKTLEMYLGMSQGDADTSEWRGTDQGTQLKNTSGWNSGGNGSNTSGFTALPGGYRNYNGPFSNVGYFGIWWSSSENETYYAWFRYLNYGDGGVYRSYEGMKGGFSVRCLRDF